ncbi:hypothetical protein SJ146_24730, partial [Enterobacter hormaechei]|nr:hypothetical protein [Enterobacter hormaechei]
MQYKKPENFTHFGAKSNLKRRSQGTTFAACQISGGFHRERRMLKAPALGVRRPISGLGSPAASY